MTWYLDDDQTAYAPWVMEVPRAERNAVVGARHRCATWSAGNGTDGLLPAEIAEGIASPTEIGHLLRVGKWVRAGDDYQMTDWKPGNKLHAEVTADREAAKGRMRNHRAGSPERSTEQTGERAGARSAARSDVRSPIVPERQGSSFRDKEKALSGTNSERSAEQPTSERSAEQPTGPYSPLPYLQRHVPEKLTPASREVAAAAVQKIRDDLAARRRDRDAASGE